MNRLDYEKGITCALDGHNEPRGPEEVLQCDECWLRVVGRHFMKEYESYCNVVGGILGVGFKKDSLHVIVDSESVIPCLPKNFLNVEVVMIVHDQIVPL